MTNPIQTCATCPHVTIKDLAPGIRLPGCGGVAIPFVVPHKTGTGGPLTFWRIPANCPRPDDEVVKREKIAPPKLWEEIE